ncbi:MAG: DNA polymerase IV [Actinomycetota bacterium]|nr:DNA polymerase IV [Actinomycetota bacterium]
MRAAPTVLHLDLDAFYAAVEQRDKPSLRGRPVIVGGVGGRGVVATASYEARAYGVRSAMSTAEARRRCPHAAYLTPRFGAYQAASDLVLAQLRELSPLVEPLSLDEAFVDLAPTAPDAGVDDLRELAEQLRAQVRTCTGGLTASVGLATSKLVAKIASDLDKPDGLVVVPPGTEQDLLAPLPVRLVPGVGPATEARLRRLGARTVADVAALPTGELVRELGQVHGAALARLARARDDRPIVSERDTKSVSVEDTFDADLTDPALLHGLTERMATKVVGRLQQAGLSGRTVTLKIRLHDFTTHSRAATLPGPTDNVRVVRALARRLLDESDTGGGVRLLGVGVSGLADWIQDDLFDGALADPTTIATAGYPDASVPAALDPDAAEAAATALASTLDRQSRRDPHPPGADVVHDVHGDGWVWGSGRGRVTVRFERAGSPPGPVRTFAADDPALRSADPPVQ